MWPGCIYHNCTEPVDAINDKHCAQHKKLNRADKRVRPPVDRQFTKPRITRDDIKKRRKSGRGVN